MSLEAKAEHYIRVFKGDPKVHSLANEKLLALLTQVRNEALEEAARVCDGLMDKTEDADIFRDAWYESAMKGIRTLKTESL